MTRATRRWAAFGGVLLLVALLGFSAVVALGFDRGSDVDRPVPAIMWDGVSVQAIPAEIPKANTQSVEGLSQDPEQNGSLTPSTDRILDRINYLSATIGPRPKGSAQEKEAASYLASTLRSFGYEVELRPFLNGNRVSTQTSLKLSESVGRSVTATAFTGSAEGAVAARLVNAGDGSAGAFPQDAREAIVVVRRGNVLFNDLLAHAAAAGARGIVVANNSPGTFVGALNRASTLPIAAISQSDGDAIIDLLARNMVEADFSVINSFHSYNVIAKWPGSKCETITGGHYDTVPGGPGASDNGSGSAVLVEIAAVLAAEKRAENHCFCLFGAEEPQLLGSQAFVSEMDRDSRESLKVMINLDMVGYVGANWFIYGSDVWMLPALDIADRLGIAATQHPLTTDSDHWSFARAGLPVVWLYGGRDALYHTPQDTLDHLQPSRLEQAAKFGLELLREAARRH